MNGAKSGGMSVSSPFINRPIATSLLGFATILGGALGYFSLPVSSLPQVDFPTIQVSTQLPGANPQTMSTLVTASLERELGQIPALATMTSTSAYGLSQITLQFNLGRDIDAAAQDVQSAINAAGSTLPRNLPYPPTYAKVNPADAPIVTLALTSDTVSMRDLSDLADTLIAQRLSTVTGVGHVSVEGGVRPAVRIEADVSRLAGYGLSMSDLNTAIVGANVAGPKGSLDGTHQSYTIAANDQITSPEAYRDIVVAYRNNAPVRLRDVAEVKEGLENARVGGWYNGTPAVIVDVQRQPGANVIETVDRLQAELPRLEHALPSSVKLTLVHDRTGTIRASIRDVQFTLCLSVALVVMVVLIFLRSGRATIIAGVALPVSLIATFGVMWFCGFSLDNLSLMALTIGTGFVVDDAIVMIENIVRHLEKGAKPLRAALDGAREIGFTVISLTLSLIAVFIPLLFMTGLVGRMFSEFALTLTIAVVVSAVVSLTLTPMMCAQLLKRQPERKRGFIARGFNWGIDGVVEGYRRSLEWVLRHQPATLFVTALTLLITVWLYVIAPKGFLPAQDTGLITATIEAEPQVSFTELSRLQETVADAVRNDPAVDSVVSIVGVGDLNTTPNLAHLKITLKAAQGARSPFRRPRRPPGRPGRRHSRRHRLLPAGSRRADRHAQQPRPVPVRAGQHRRRRGRGMGEAAGSRARLIARAARRQSRDPERRPARPHRGRPRDGGPPRRDRAGGQRRAERRLRPAPGVDHLRAGQPVPRRARGDAAIPQRPFAAVAPLRALLQRRAGAADRHRAHRAHDGAAVRQPPGPVPLRDHQLQPGARTPRSATRWRPSPPPKTRSACRPRSPEASSATPTSSPGRSPRSPGSSSPRSSPSTSCWACSTRASSTPSPS